ncbi:HEXXH motif-containing putative peptide modification protein [Streptomyces maoxianensis]|uniref:HEXXH motif-containing putative peptide modification protein n=1 Tax=Streptomyces maoxianensis TaxID=1459942 RepID=A0ABV9GDX3_9ACTN
MTIPTAETLFSLAGVEEHRQDRTRRIGTVLGNRIEASAEYDEALTYAVAHHLLEGAEHAARNQDAESLAWYRQSEAADFHDLTTDTEVGRCLIVQPERAELLQSPLSETAYYLLRPDSARASDATLELVTRAIASATSHGFGPLLKQHSRVICLLDKRKLDETLHSWSLTRLPGTVFTDYTEHPEVLARDLIHEAAHNCLNNALAARQIKLPADVTFFSPWRGTPRPVFGFLHACWAFALTTLYAQKAQLSAGAQAADFFAAYFSRQHGQLMAASDSLTVALPFLADHEIRERIGVAVSTAVAAASVRA